MYISVLASTILFPIFCVAQETVHNEEGVIVIKVQGFKDSISPAATSFNYRYFIKGNKILRNDSIIEPELSNNGKNQRSHQNLRLKINAASAMRFPKYLIDLNTNQCTIFYKEKGKPFASVDSLKNNPFESFYRLKLFPNLKQHTILFGSKKFVDTILGKKCLAAKAIYSSGDTFLIKYTTERLTMTSPLNYFVPGFSHQILELQVVANSGKDNFYIKYEVGVMRREKLNSGLFTIPSDVIVKHRVPISSMSEL